jgi:hypothetical protein
LHVAHHQTTRLEIAETFGENRVTNALDPSSKFRESERATSQGAKNDATPSLPQESKGAHQCLVARWGRGATALSQQIRRDRLRIGGSGHLANRTIY